MRFNSSRFGELEVEEDKVISFPRGLAGFEGLTRYCLLFTDKPVKWLHSVDDPEVAFTLVDPFVIHKDYTFTAVDEVEEFLQCNKVEHLLVLVAATIGEKEMLVNFSSPIVINTSNMKAAQLMIVDDRVPSKVVVPIAAG
ncbi:MAG: flagellar assembly protein FliW [Candidatus Magnetobacterium sp. LHC-1]|uniref:Flagellar assembly factor FliW n=1 Tax=Candidatus Magnetobacterium casense TaxID=1455061 RepID=A0ABS6S1N7_9BACT|nr:flagellar assembly protein FliW [Candidatus Magnetobacterium casensis]MBF0607389.1 flagellar assembly protein FliW [Nitrospirota bacterium]MBV6342767.1 flagellar assembly protein FliW [Candidatus Magnetobacterium casensis]